MLHGAGEMHVEDERHARGLAETAIGETDALGFDELRGCGLMGMSRHRPSAIEKKSGVRQEEVRVLKVRCVAGVRVDDQLCIGVGLRKRERIDGRYHDVPVPCMTSFCWASFLRSLIRSP